MDVEDFLSKKVFAIEVNALTSIWQLLEKCLEQAIKDVSLLE